MYFMECIIIQFNTMTDNLTSDMHAEFTIDTETELKHKAGCVWKLLGSHYTQAQLARYCALYGITIEQALQWKRYWI